MPISDNRRIAKNTILLYVRSVLIILVSLYTTRVTLEVLGEENYGIYVIIGGTVMLFSMLGNSMITASQRFITYALGKRDEANLKVTFDTCVSLHIVVATILLPILECLGLWLLYNKLSIPEESIHAAFWVMQCSIISLLLNIVLIPFTALIIAHERMSAYAYISIIEVFLKLTGVLCLKFMFSDKLIAYAVILTSIAIILQFIYSVYSHRHFMESRNVKFGINGPLFKEMFAFSGWNLIGSGSALLRNQGIDILLNIYFGVTVNAAKGICSQVQSAVMQFVTNFQTAVNPQLIKAIATEDYSRNHVLVMQGGRFSFYLMSLFSIPIISNCATILGLWLNEIPGWTESFVQWTLIYCLWDCLSRFLINTILACGNIRNYQLVVGGTKLTALPIAWIILYYGGSPLTGIVVNIGIEVICLMERLWFNNKRTSLSAIGYLLGTVGQCWLVFVLALSISMIFKAYVSSNVFIMLPFSLTITVAVVWTIGLHGNERKAAVKLVASKLSFIR